MINPRFLGATCVSVVIAIIASVAAGDFSSPCSDIIGDGGADLLRQRRQVISQMTNALRTEDRSHMGPIQHYAAFMLGEFRAEEGIELLIEWLGAETPCALTEGKQEPYEYFPAAQALVKIGSPAVPSLLAVATDPKIPKLQRETAVWVMLKIERIEQRAYATSDKKVKAGVYQRFGETSDEGSRIPREFIVGYVAVEATFGEMATLPDGVVLPKAIAGRKYEHRFRAKPPEKHPDAPLTYNMYCEFKEGICQELSMNESGDIRGVPSKPGVYEFQVTVAAKHNDKTTYAARMMRLPVVAAEE